jgi:NadR type nicotinamide-nucleotide adenylyltransferase
MTSICLHGAESTGKSALAEQLATHFGCEVVPEYGRSYCEVHGTDIDMAALVHIGQVQDALNLEAAARTGRDPVIFDTDSLITSVWAQMMFGRADPWFASTEPVADLYLLMDIDLPFVDDGLRVYSGQADRHRFFDLSRAVLEERGVRWALVSGQGAARLNAALEAIGAKHVLR